MFVKGFERTVSCGGVCGCGLRVTMFHCHCYQQQSSGCTLLQRLTPQHQKVVFFTAVPIGMHIVHMCTHAYIIPCINMHIGCGVWNIYFYEDHKNFPTLCMFMAFNLIVKIQLFLEHPSLWVRVEIPTFRRACNYHLHDARSHGNASSLQFFKAGLYECRS